MKPFITPTIPPPAPSARGGTIEIHDRPNGLVEVVIRDIALLAAAVAVHRQLTH